jgi:hypothetical protein
VKPKAPLGADLVIPGLALAFAAYFFFSIADLAWEAKANGVVIGAILVILVLVQVCRIGSTIVRGEAGFGMQALLNPRDALRKRIGMVLITLAFIATLQWLGVTLGILLALAASLWIMGVRSRMALVIVPLAIAAAMYLLFVALLQTDIPHGPIELMMTKLLS